MPGNLCQTDRSPLKGNDSARTLTAPRRITVLPPGGNAVGNSRHVMYDAIATYGLSKVLYMNTKPCLVSRVLFDGILCFLLDNGDVRRRKPLWTLLDFELHLITLIQALVPACRDGIEVDEDIFAARA